MNSASIVVTELALDHPLVGTELGFEPGAIAYSDTATLPLP